MGAPVIDMNGIKLLGVAFDHQPRYCRLGVQSSFDGISKYYSWIIKTVDSNETPDFTTQSAGTTSTSEATIIES